MALWFDCEDLGKSQLKFRLSNWIGVQSNLFNQNKSCNFYEEFKPNLNEGQEET